MKTVKLHDLILMAKCGKKFRAKRSGITYHLNQTDFKQCDSWGNDAIVADWTYEEIIEPLKLETDVKFLEFCGKEAVRLNIAVPTEFGGKTFKMVLTEIQSEVSDGN